MTEHLLKLLAAYAAGTAATAFMVSLVWLAPLPDYAKHLLSWVLPLPVILIVLTLLYYGPQSFAEGEALPNTPSGVARVFLLGTLTAFACFAVTPVIKFVFRRLTGGENEEDEPEE
ncbi:MAG: hypothetical protein Q7J98_02965 [Kiritimatiellia bacterium]|nr:hypothetical protein [Kiritimatiellia bacterium]